MIASSNSNRISTARANRIPSRFKLMKQPNPYAIFQSVNSIFNLLLSPCFIVYENPRNGGNRLRSSNIECGFTGAGSLAANADFSVENELFFVLPLTEKFLAIQVRGMLSIREATGATVEISIGGQSG